MLRLIPIVVLSLGLMPASYSAESSPKGIRGGRNSSGQQQPRRPETPSTRGPENRSPRPTQPRPQQPYNPGQHYQPRPQQPSAPVPVPKPYQPRPEQPRPQQPYNPGQHNQPGHYQPRPEQPRPQQPYNPGQHNQPGHYQPRPQPAPRPEQPRPQRPYNPGQHYQPRPVSRPVNRNYNHQREVVHNNVRVVQRTNIRYVDQRRVERQRYYNYRNYNQRQVVVYRPYYTYNYNYWTYYSRPFARTWCYNWGWTASVWYGQLRWYYTPYSCYPTAAYWVTDYVISSMLDSAYQRGYRDGQYASGYAPLSEDLKTQLRLQVDQESAQIRNNDSVGVDQALQDPNYIFAVDSYYDAVNVYSGQPCRLSEGDFIRVTQRPSYDSSEAVMTVVAAKPGSCVVGSQISVDINDLQEMLNSFSENVDDGLTEFGKHQSEIPY